MDPAVAQCDALLSAESIAAVTGAEVTSARASLIANGYFPESPSCEWTLADGSTIRLATELERSGSEPISILKAMSFGGSPVKSLPQPAASVVYDGEGQLIAARVGPLLTEAVIFQARSAEGKADDLGLLERLALASAAQPAPAGPVDPQCAAHLGIPVVSTQRYEAPSVDSEDGTDLNCGYDLGDGTAVILNVRWAGPDGLPSCCEKVKALGQGAFAQQQGRGKKAPWELQWVLAKGDPARTAELSNGGGAARQLSKKELIEIAKGVTLGEAVASTPTSPPAGVAPPAEAAPLLGSWTFPGAEGSLELPAGLTVTLTFSADGTVVVDYGCKPRKTQPLSWPGTFSADATTLDITWATRYKGACKGNDANNFSQPFSFMMSMMTTPGGWSVSGDTLTLTATEGPGVGGTMEFQRAAP